MISTRTLAFVVCVPLALAIGFAAGRATASIGTIAEARSPDGASYLRVSQPFSLAPVDQRLSLGGANGETELLRFDVDTGPAGPLIWAPDGSIAGVLRGGATLVVIDAANARVLYEQPLLERMDGTRVARGVGFSTNAMAVTFDDCPREGAGCRPQFLALPRR